MKKRLSFRIFLFLVSIDLLETFAQFCFKKSAISGHSLEVINLVNLLGFLKLLVLSPFLWLGLFSVFFIFVTWSAVLSKIDLSVAVPVCSFSYITVPLVSMVFFHEHVSILRWSGIGLILIGVILVSISSRSEQGAT